MDELTVHTSDEVAVAERRREIGLLAASTVLSNPNYKPSDTTVYLVPNQDPIPPPHE
jgi:hypothetical protein